MSKRIMMIGEVIGNAIECWLCDRTWMDDSPITALKRHVVFHHKIELSSDSSSSRYRYMYIKDGNEHLFEDEEKDEYSLYLTPFSF